MKGVNLKMVTKDNIYINVKGLNFNRSSQNAENKI